MSTAIKVENLSKIYRLGEIGTGTISRDLERWVKMNVLGKEDPFLKIGESNDRSQKGSSDLVYSLQDLNFEIQQGDAVGIIGRNGAGKSTLLKILSRVTTPTKGKINIKGRVASLLEVGTGFHPELTGRENIYLNGAILGMRKREIDHKFDEIVDFSGVERYIDTPVKRYSSGMYVRLAFAVAAHLESEILIVDEVLAVGDAEFQKKCLGKMTEVSKLEGRTVIFVSHNMGSIQQLCNKSLLLNQGKSISLDSTNKVINTYSNFSDYLKNNDINIELLPFPKGKSWSKGEILKIRVSWVKSMFMNGCICDLAFYTYDGIKLFVIQSDKIYENVFFEKEISSVVFEIINPGFISRELRLDVGLKDEIKNKYVVLSENICSISIPMDIHNERYGLESLIVTNVKIKI